jgi:hypothetical protein
VCVRFVQHAQPILEGYNPNFRHTHTIWPDMHRKPAPRPVETRRTSSESAPTIGPRASSPVTHSTHGVISLPTTSRPARKHFHPHSANHTRDVLRIPQRLALNSHIHHRLQIGRLSSIIVVLTHRNGHLLTQMYIVCNDPDIGTTHVSC